MRGRGMKWTVTTNVKLSPKGYGYLILCKCDCGESVWKIRSHLLGKNSPKSCASCVKRNFRHGWLNTRLYGIWSGMIQRCTNPVTNNFHDYGGRGIRVCKLWSNDFIEFKDWALQNGYKDNLTIERKNVNGGYIPKNCTWIPPALQHKNTRRSCRITVNGVTKILSDWEKESPVNRSTIVRRVRAGWKPYDAIFTARLK